MLRNGNPDIVTVMRHLLLLFIFVWSAAASPRHLEERLIQEGFQKADLEAAVVRTRFTSSHNGVEHFYYRQAFKGLEIWGADMSLHLDKQGEVLTLNHSFEANLARKRIMVQKVLPADLVVEMVAEQLGLGEVKGVKTLKQADTSDRAFVELCD